MKEKLEDIKAALLEMLENAGDLSEIEAARVRFLGKKGELTAILKQMGQLSPVERPQMGQVVNQVRSFIEERLDLRLEEMQKRLLKIKLEKEKIDVTLPGTGFEVGSKHPLSQVKDQAVSIFTGLGFSVVDGPDVEYDYYNFEALNMPKNHPARDTQDTFYFSPNMLLRTQTSSVQIRYMENHQPPIKIVAPGRVFRCDTVDATHSPLFHQMEGLVVDKGVTMADLKGTLQTFAQKLYGDDVKVRFRPHHFPYTEPSAEMDVMCFACKGEGCRLCKDEGYIEILGAGMVHPWVLKNCGIDPEIYSGFAFGVGLERLTMRKYNITDLRLLFENDVRFLGQF